MPRRKKDGRRVMTVSPTTANVLEGVDDVRTWTDEELIRGQRKASNGKFVGRPPDVVARACAVELLRRQGTGSLALFAGNLDRVSQRVVEIVLDPATDRQVALNGARLIFAYTLGKPPDRMIVDVRADAEPVWMQMLRGSVVGIVPTVTDAEVVETEAW